MIPRMEHQDPIRAWEILEGFIGAVVTMPNGKPASPSLVKIITVGAWIGCRLALIQREFALSIAEGGNAMDDSIMEGIRAGFRKAYIVWLVQQADNYMHNMGFTDIPVGVSVPEEEHGVSHPIPPPQSPITDEDVKNIMDGLDNLFGGGK